MDPKANQLINMDSADTATLVSSPPRPPTRPSLHDTSASTAYRKPSRLSQACNQCRKRKVRCDVSLPKCTNCTLRGETCVTTDPRRPGVTNTVRRRAFRQRPTPEEDGHDDGQTSQTSSSHPSDERSHSIVCADRRASIDEPPRRASHTAEETRERDAGEATRSFTAQSQRTPTSDSGTCNSGQKKDLEHASWVHRAYLVTTESELQRSGLEDAGALQLTPDTTPDMVVHEDGLTSRSKFFGGSSLQCLFNFVDLFLSSYGFDPSAPLFKHGMAHSEEFTTSLTKIVPDLPDRQSIDRYLDAYFSLVWPLYPVVDRHTVESDVEAFLQLQDREPHGLQRKIQPSQVPKLTTIYAIICIGMSELPPTEGESPTDFLSACYNLHVHLIAQPYFSSLQALVLTSLALRSQGKDGQAWHMAGQAIRMAISLGLHVRATRNRPLAKTAPAQEEAENDLRERVWWSCYCLEKIMQLESGRPSTFQVGADLSTAPGPDSGAASPTKPVTCFEAWCSLAKIIAQISDRLYFQRQDGSGGMLAETARLDARLDDWSASLPERLRPRNTFPTQRNNEQVIAVFLDQQLHHARVAVLQTAIVFPEKSFVAEIEKRSKDIPQVSRLAGGASICVHAARSIVLNTLQLADIGVRSSLVGLPQTFLAITVLALGILRQPRNRLARPDLELLTSASEHIEACYRQLGQSASFIAIMLRLRTRVAAAVQKAAAAGTGAATGLSGSSPAKTRQEAVSWGDGWQGEGQHPQGDNYHASQVVTWPFSTEVPEGDAGANAGAVPGLEGLEAFNNLEFDEMWTMMDSDFLMLDAGGSFQSF